MNNNSVSFEYVDYDDDDPPPLAALQDPFETSTTVKCCCIKNTADCNSNATTTTASPPQQSTTMNPVTGLMFSSRISSFSDECPKDQKHCCYDMEDEAEGEDFIRTCESHKNDIIIKNNDDNWRELCTEKNHLDNCGIR